VPVGQKQVIEVTDGNGERIPVAGQEGPFLIEAAIHQQAESARFEGVAGAGDLPGRAQKTEFHRVCRRPVHEFLAIQSSQLLRRGKYMNTRTIDTASSA